MAEPLLRLESIAKSFGEVSALKPIHLDLYEGEVLGLVGENGAGKSTLIKILSGVHQPDSGTIRWNGTGIRIGSPLQAIQTGIATIHQELAYFGRLTVAENLMMGDRWPRFPWGGVRWSRLHRQARERLDRCGLDIPTDRFVDDLSPAQKQEIGDILYGALQQATAGVDRSAGFALSLELADMDGATYRKENNFEAVWAARAAQ